MDDEYDSFDDDDVISDPITKKDEVDDIPPTPPPGDIDELDIPPTPSPHSIDSFDTDEIIQPSTSKPSQDSFDNDMISPSKNNSIPSEDSFDKDDIVRSKSISSSQDSFMKDDIMKTPSHDSFDDDITFIGDDNDIPATPPPNDEEGDDLPSTPPPIDDEDDDIPGTPPPEEDNETKDQSEDEEDRQKESKKGKNYNFLRYPNDDGMRTVVRVNKDVWSEEPPIEAIHCMKKYFGHTSFRPNQWNIIRGVLQGRDQLAIMATGYGKSVCYQLPSLLRADLTIVVSPLLSLIEDQLQGLRVRKIRSATINGNTSLNDRSDIENEALNGSLHFLYLTPEFIQSSDSFLSRISHKVTVVAIDEAHCVSQWGHDFRASYRLLSKLKRLLHPVTMLAVTATATPSVAEDIIRSLGMINAQQTRTDLNRKNIFLSVNKSCVMDNDLCGLLKDDDKKGRHFGGPSIIYCQSRKDVQSAYDILLRAGVRVGMYHAGMSDGMRMKTHHNFINDRITTVVATIAFGMGIDKPDVRTVIHYGAPKNIESFYQEIGRAGRDGDSSSSIVFYNEKDITKNRSLLLQNCQSLSEAYRSHSVEMANHMETYLTTLLCRRRNILTHFSTVSIPPSSPKGGCCDNCDRLLEGNQDGSKLVIDVTQEARLALTVISKIYHGETGAGKPIAFLKGSAKEEYKTKNISSKLKDCFGEGKDKSEGWWKELIMKLRMKGFIEEHKIRNSFGMVINVTRAGEAFLSRTSEKMEVDATPILLKTARGKGTKNETSNKSVHVVREHEKKELSSIRSRQWKSGEDLGLNPKSSNLSPSDIEARNQLKNILEEVRGRISDEMDIAPFLVASNKVIEQIASIVPSNMKSLDEVTDWPEEKKKSFGPHFISECKKFASERGMKIDTHLSSMVMLPSGLQSVFDDLSPTYSSTYKCHLFSGSSISEISNIRSLSESTVSNHLGYCALLGLPLHMDILKITIKMRDTVYKEICMKLGRDICLLKPIMECLPPDFIDYNRLKIIQKILEYEYGLKDEEKEGEEREEVKEMKKPQWMNNLSSTEPPIKKKKVAL